MSTDREVTAIVRSWLEEGVTALPDRVLDTVLDQLPATPQRRSWWPARRFGDMNTSVRFALVAAAVAVVAVVGMNLIPGSDGLIGGSVPSPTATPAPIPVPPDADLDAGTAYYIDQAWAVGSPRLVFTVPADGWFSLSNVNIGKNVILDDASVHDVAMTPWAPDNLYADPCHWKGGGTLEPPVGPTVADLAAALVEQAGGDTPGPTEVTISGYTGLKVELSLPADLDLATCDERDFGRFTESYGGPELGEVPPYKGGHIYGNGQHNTMYILDIDGQRAMIDTNYQPGTTEATLAELQQLVESIRIEP